LAAWCLQQRHLLDWPAAQADDREHAVRLARAAIAGGDESPLGLTLGGAVLAILTRDHGTALAAADRAMIINTNAAVVLAFDALPRSVWGTSEAAIEHAERAFQLSPLEPLVYHAAFAFPWRFSSPAALKKRWPTPARRSRATAILRFPIVC